MDKNIEILAGELDFAIQELQVNAVKTYDDGIYQVWEMPNTEFQKLNINNWKDKYGWWRFSTGSILEKPMKRFKINNHYIRAWDGDNRLKYESYTNRVYDDLYEYLEYEMCVGSLKNITALLVDLAKYNNLTLAELLKKYNIKENKK